MPEIKTNPLFFMVSWFLSFLFYFMVSFLVLKVLFMFKSKALNNRHPTCTFAALVLVVSYHNKLKPFL